MAEQSEAAALQSAADARQAEAAARGVVYVMIDKEVTEVSCAGCWEITVGELEQWVVSSFGTE